MIATLNAADAPRRPNRGLPRRQPGVQQRHRLVASLPEEATTALVTIEFWYPNKESELEVKITAVPKIQ